eukprot:439873_1
MGCGGSDGCGLKHSRCFDFGATAERQIGGGDQIQFWKQEVGIGWTTNNSVLFWQICREDLDVPAAGATEWDALAQTRDLAGLSAGPDARRELEGGRAGVVGEDPTEIFIWMGGDCGAGVEIRVERGDVLDEIDRDSLKRGEVSVRVAAVRSRMLTSRFAARHHLESKHSCQNQKRILTHHFHHFVC